MIASAESRQSESVLSYDLWRICDLSVLFTPITPSPAPVINMYHNWLGPKIPFIATLAYDTHYCAMMTFEMLVSTTCSFRAWKLRVLCLFGITVWNYGDYLLAILNIRRSVSYVHLWTLRHKGLKWTTAIVPKCSSRMSDSSRGCFGDGCVDTLYSVPRIQRHTDRTSVHICV